MSQVLVPAFRSQILLARKNLQVLASAFHRHSLLQRSPHFVCRRQRKDSQDSFWTEKRSRIDFLVYDPMCATTHVMYLRHCKDINSRGRDDSLLERDKTILGQEYHYIQLWCDVTQFVSVSLEIKIITIRNSIKSLIGLCVTTSKINRPIKNTMTTI